MDIFNPTENDVYENSESTFPAYRYWKDGELLGDNFDIYISVVYGDPEVLGVTQAEDYWVAEVVKDGVHQEKKFFSQDYFLAEGETPPYSEHPQRVEEYVEKEPEAPTTETQPVGEDGVVAPVIPPEVVLPPEQDTGDIIVGSGNGPEVDYGVPLESLTEDEVIEEPEPEYIEVDTETEYIDPDSLMLVVGEDGYITEY